MAEGNCFRIVGGWFDNRLIYNGSSLGFLYGEYFPVRKSSVRSRKFVVFRFVSIVKRSPSFLKWLTMSLRARSAVLPDIPRRTANPSSR